MQTINNRKATSHMRFETLWLIGVITMNQILAGPEDLPQDQKSQTEKVAVFRLHKLGTGMKNRIKSLGCQWNTMLHGWVCTIDKQAEIQKILQEAGLQHDPQVMTLPKGVIPSDPKIASLQSRFEILEQQLHKSEILLLQDVYRYDPCLRPEDFAQPPPNEGKSSQKLLTEKDFHNRWAALQKKKEDIEQARKELSHLSTDPGEKRFDSDAPLLIAEALIQECFLSQGHRTLQYCSDTFLEWNGSKYVELCEEDIRKAIYNFLRDAKKVNDGGHIKNFNPNKFRVDHIIDALRAICHISHCHANGVIWLDDRNDPDPKRLIPFRNGLLDMANCLEHTTTELIPHTPLLLNINALDFDFDPHAPEPQEWLKFLNAIWPEDQESRQTLQEWAGYLLIQDTRQHKILLIVGPPRSGKGTIGRILHELLGRFNVVGPTLSSLGTEFGLQPLLNKMLATISDARLNGRGNNSLIIERLLSISGEDPLTINRKFLPPLTVQLPTRMMMMSNELPDMRDASGALAKRYIVLVLQKSWFGHEDTHLFSRLRIELPGILLWALEGLSRLQKRGKFIQPTSSFQVIEELEVMTSPIRAFISERCEVNPHAITPVQLLFNAWRDWCSLTGHPFSGNIQSFGKNLRAAFPGIGISRPQEDSIRERCYHGISLIPSQNPSADVHGHSWSD
jgi:putative DNA primase/helicase